MKVFALYATSALVSTAANLLVQEAIFRMVGVSAFALALVAGTATGFAVKYALDKLVFVDGYSGASDEIRKISLYFAFAILTTLIFWTFEIAFWAIWGTTAAKYTGAILGLAIGYVLKFLLDRRFVFRKSPALDSERV